MDKETLFYMSADTLEDLKPIRNIFDLSGKGKTDAHIKHS